MADQFVERIIQISKCWNERIGPSTMNSFLPEEIPQNSLAVQQTLQISQLQFEKFPHLHHWVKEVAMVDPVDELKSSRSIEG